MELLSVHLSVIGDVAFSLYQTWTSNFFFVYIYIYNNSYADIYSNVSYISQEINISSLILLLFLEG